MRVVSYLLLAKSFRIDLDFVGWLDRFCLARVLDGDGDGDGDDNDDDDDRGRSFFTVRTIPSTPQENT